MASAYFLARKAILTRISSWSSLMTARRTETRSCSLSGSFSLAMSRQSWRTRSTLYTKLVLPKLGTLSYKTKVRGIQECLYGSEQMLWPLVTAGCVVQGASNCTRQYRLVNTARVIMERASETATCRGEQGARRSKTWFTEN